MTRRFRITPAIEHDGDGAYGVVNYSSEDDGEWVSWDEHRAAVAAERLRMEKLRNALRGLLIRETVEGYDLVRRLDVLMAFDVAK